MSKASAEAMPSFLIALESVEHRESCALMDRDATGPCSCYANERRNKLALRLDAAIDAARAEERERCAKLLDTLADSYDDEERRAYASDRAALLRAQYEAVSNAADRIREASNQ